MDIQSKQIDRLCEKLALKHGIHKNTVKMIIMTEFEMVKETMKKVDSYNNHFPYVRLEYFCCFKVKDGKKQFFLNKSKKIIEDVYSQSEQGDDRTADVTDPGVRKIWDRDTSKSKEKATKEFAYIYFVGDYKSEYNIYGIEKRKMIGQEIMGDPGYVSDDLMENAIKKYMTLQETSSMRYLRNIRDMVDSIIKFNNALKYNETSDIKTYDPAKATKAMKDVGSIVEDLEKWEKKVYGEEDQMAIRGGGKVGLFEDPEKASWMTSRAQL